MESPLARAVITIDLRGMRDADLALVDVLARLQLLAARRGGRIRVRNAPTNLCGLLDLAGLRDVIDCAGPAGPESGAPASAVEARRQPEEREEALGVEEEGDPGDPAA